MEPRDKVFALIPLANDCNYQADYSKSLFEVYQDIINIYFPLVHKPIYTMLVSYDALEALSCSVKLQRLLRGPFTIPQNMDRLNVKYVHLTEEIVIVPPLEPTLPDPSSLDIYAVFENGNYASATPDPNGLSAIFLQQTSSNREPKRPPLPRLQHYFSRHCLTFMVTSMDASRILPFNKAMSISYVREFRQRTITERQHLSKALATILKRL